MSANRTDITKKKQLFLRKSHDTIFHTINIAAINVMVTEVAMSRKTESKERRSLSRASLHLFRVSNILRRAYVLIRERIRMRIRRTRVKSG